MSRTVRKTKRGKVVRDGVGCYTCKCDYCLNLEKKKLEVEIAETEIEIGIEEYENRYDEHPKDDNWH